MAPLVRSGSSGGVWGRWVWGVVVLVVLTVGPLCPVVEARSKLTDTLKIDTNVNVLNKLDSQSQRVRRQVPQSPTTDRRQLFLETRTYPMIDIIFALERSSMGRNSRYNFEMVQKKFVRTFIRDFLHVKPDSVRISLVTYGRDVLVVYDGISDPLTKCDLIGTDFTWDQIRYIDGPTSQGANLTGVFKEAARMLAIGRSFRASRSMLILLTSGQYTEYDPGRIGYRDWFDTYGVGVDDQVDRVFMSRVVRNRQTDVYGTISEWRDTMRTELETAHVLASDLGPDWVAQLRVHSCSCPQGSACHCDTRTGFTRCTCTGGYMDSARRCVRPCDQNVCQSQGATCTNAFGGLFYTCNCGPSNPNCDLRNIRDCQQGVCQNGGTCYDGRDQYACQCPPGFGGINCEINEDECRDPRMCPLGQTCLDGINSFSCINSAGQTLTPGTPFPFTNAPRPQTPFPSIPQTPVPPFTQTPFPTAAPTPFPTAAPTPFPTAAPTPFPPAPQTPFPTQRPLTNPGVPFTQAPTQWPGQKTTSLTPEVNSDQLAASGSFLDNLTSDQRLLLTVVPPAGLGLIVLLLGIGALIYVVRHRDDRKKNDLSGVTETTSVASHNPSLMTFDSKCYKDEGTPGPPKLPKLTKAQEADPKRVSYGEFDEMLYGNEAIQRGMEEWYAYVLELYHNQGLNRILIVRLDGEKWVLSPGSKLYMDEVEALFNLLSKKMTAATFNMQGREFGIVGNTDFVLMAHTFRNSKREQEILCATKTRQFVIIGTANFSSDNGRCRQKVLELRDHIKVQGL